MSDKFGELEAIAKIMSDMAEDMRDDFGDLPYRLVGEYIASIADMASTIGSEVRKLRRLEASPPAGGDSSCSQGSSESLDTTLPEAEERADPPFRPVMGDQYADTQLTPHGQIKGSWLEYTAAPARNDEGTTTPSDGALVNEQNPLEAIGEQEEPFSQKHEREDA